MRSKPSVCVPAAAISSSPPPAASPPAGEPGIARRPHRADGPERLLDRGPDLQRLGGPDRRLQLTQASSTPVINYAGYQAGSVFASTPVDVTRFHTRFTFEITPGYLNRPADGLTFTIQGNGPTALGGTGGDLGYGPAGARRHQQFQHPQERRRQIRCLSERR